jgi:undecaprenyl-diphosphatase
MPHHSRWSRLTLVASRLERGVLMTVFLSAAALFAFGKLAEEVVEGDTRAFDEWLLLALRNPVDHADPLGPHWLEEMARDFTALGSTGVMAFITAAVIGFLLLVKKRAAALMVTISVIGGVLLGNLLKYEFGRPRPDLVPHSVVVYTQSFPSSHAMMSAVVYLTLGALLARVQAQRGVKVYLLLISVALTFIVGVSRVYLGVHWPTDVLAGWSVGASWAVVCWLAMMWMQSRGKVETSASGERGLPTP